MTHVPCTVYCAVLSSRYNARAIDRHNTPGGWCILPRWGTRHYPSPSSSKQKKDQPRHYNPEAAVREATPLYAERGFDTLAIPFFPS
jgi:hypothetical protein